MGKAAGAQEVGDVEEEEPEAFTDLDDDGDEDYVAGKSDEEEEEEVCAAVCHL